MPGWVASKFHAWQIARLYPRPDTPESRAAGEGRN
jgi:hypothetical protein